MTETAVLGADPDVSSASWGWTPSAPGLAVSGMAGIEAEHEAMDSTSTVTVQRLIATVLPAGETPRSAESPTRAARWTDGCYRSSLCCLAGQTVFAWGLDLALPRLQSCAPVPRSCACRCLAESALAESAEPSPFEVIDLKLGTEEGIRRQVAGILRMQGIPYRQRLRDRLSSLLDDACDEDPETWRFSMGSLQGLAAFLASTPRVGYPDVGLSPDGDLVAQWRASPSRKLVMEFRSPSEVAFALFAQNAYGATSVLYGVDTPTAVWQTALSHGASAWCGYGQ